MVIALCDNESIHREIVKSIYMDYLVERDYKADIIEFSSGEDLLTYKGEFNLVLLDVEMNGIDGIEIKERLEKEKRDIIIIFITSHIEIIEDAFGKNVYGFLKKPINKDRFYKIMDKAVEEIEDEFILEIESNGKNYLKCNSILYIKAEDKYTIIKTYENKYLVRKSLNEWKNILSKKNFYQTHRTYIVNLAHVVKFDDYVYMINGEKVKLSRLNKRNFKDTYFEYIKWKSSY